MADTSSFDKLPEPLKKQIAGLRHIFIHDEHVQVVYEIDCKEAGVEPVKCVEDLSEANKKLLDMAMLKVVAADYLLDVRFFPFVFCYDDNGHIAKLEKVFDCGRYVFLIKGRVDDTPVIVKWYQNKRRDTSYEIGIYNKLKELGCPVPWFSSTYEFWNTPVLVIEELQPLGKEDDEFVVAVEVLNQLQYLHQVAVYNNMKPADIVKRVVDGKTTYFLIDYGGVATQKLEHGYRRWCWTPKWTSQTPHEKDQVTTAKNDFLELGSVIKTLQEDNGRYECNDKLERFMKRVNEVNEKNIMSKDYLDLIAICKDVPGPKGYFSNLWSYISWRK